MPYVATPVEIDARLRIDRIGDQPFVQLDLRRLDVGDGRRARLELNDAIRLFETRRDHASE